MNNAKSPPRAVRYIRVSRLDQRPQLQSDEINALIDRRGWELVDTYLDQGASGSRDRRRELDRMLADAKRGKFDTLVVWKSDRLFRSLKHFVVTIDELSAIGVSFVSVTEPFDDTPQGKLLLTLVSAFAEFERALVIERTRSGLDAARRRGVQLGRPKATVDVNVALQMRADGKSYREIGHALKVGAATVHRALKANPGGVPNTPPQSDP